MYACVCMCVCVYVCMYVCMYDLYACKYDLYVCTYDVYLCMYVWMCHRIPVIVTVTQCDHDSDHAHLCSLALDGEDHHLLSFACKKRVSSSLMLILMQERRLVKNSYGKMVTNNPVMVTP
jgi:hypothetical protein